MRPSEIIVISVCGISNIKTIIIIIIIIIIIRISIYTLVFIFQLAVMTTGVQLVRHVDIVTLEIYVIKLQDIVHSVRLVGSYQTVQVGIPCICRLV